MNTSPTRTMFTRAKELVSELEVLSNDIYELKGEDFEFIKTSIDYFSDLVDELDSLLLDIRDLVDDANEIPSHKWNEDHLQALDLYEDLEYALERFEKDYNYFQIG